MGQYLPILALLVLAVLFATLSFLASKILAPRKVTLAKVTPYESGIVPGKEPPQRFPVRFYLVAMIFIVFDIEIIFFYPWAMAHRELAVFGLVAIAIFAASVFESFLYLLSKGALEWGPQRKVQAPADAISPLRTSRSTIRRVGTDGRVSPEEQQLLGAVEASDVRASDAVAGAGTGHPIEAGARH